MRLVIIGSSADDYDAKMKEYLVGKIHNIEFLGQMSFDQIKPYLEKCLCTICSSEWYENFPNSALESFAFYKSIIASDIGSLRELVTNEETGLLFEVGNANSLRDALIKMYNNPDLARAWGLNGYNKLVDKFSSQLHYHKLLNVFRELL